MKLTNIKKFEDLLGAEVLVDVTGKGGFRRQYRVRRYKETRYGVIKTADTKYLWVRFSNKQGSRYTDIGSARNFEFILEHTHPDDKTELAFHLDLFTNWTQYS